MSNERTTEGNTRLPMSNLVQMKGAESADQKVFITDVDKVELATQVAALVRASFKPFTDSDIRDVLRTAASQLSVLVPDQS
jgi:hypothetical protein